MRTPSSLRPGLGDQIPLVPAAPKPPINQAYVWKGMCWFSVLGRYCEPGLAQRRKRWWSSVGGWTGKLTELGLRYKLSRLFSTLNLNPLMTAPRREICLMKSTWFKWRELSNASLCSKFHGWCHLQWGEQKNFSKEYFFKSNPCWYQVIYEIIQRKTK